MFRLSIVTFLALLVVASTNDQVPIVKDDSVSTSASWGWSDCGSPTDLIEIYSIDISPNPPEPGKDMTILAKGRAKEEIEEGANADVTVKLGLITLLKKTFDICEEARNGNATLQCPIEAKEHVVKQTVALPKEIPHAKFSVNVMAYTVDDEDVLCLNLDVDFRNPGKIFGSW